jgi:hypothetical protein
VLNQGILKGKYHCTIDLLFDWSGLVCFANKNKKCQLSYSWFQTSQTGGQQYSDSIHWLNLRSKFGWVRDDVNNLCLHINLCHWLLCQHAISHEAKAQSFHTANINTLLNVCNSKVAEATAQVIAVSRSSFAASEVEKIDFEKLSFHQVMISQNLFSSSLK